MPGGEIDIGFVFFRSCTLKHLDRAWFTLARQDFTHVRRVQFLNNNSGYRAPQVAEVLARYPLPVPITIKHARHDGSKTHSWSVNTVCRDMATAPWVFFTRSDYLLSDHCLREWWAGIEQALAADPTRRLFATSYIHLIAHRWPPGLLSIGDPWTDEEKQVDLDTTDWRAHGADWLVGRLPGYGFEATGWDAGVWLTKREYLAQAGWMDERLVGWGFQQSIFQQRLRKLAGVTFMVAPIYFVHHQEHLQAHTRDLLAAKAEAEAAYPGIKVIGKGWQGMVARPGEDLHAQGEEAESSCGQTPDSSG